MKRLQHIEAQYSIAKEQYAELGIDCDLLIKRIDAIPISVHCWQGDDVGGFEKTAQNLSGGIQATGNYPGKPRTLEEFRLDIEKAFTHIPGEKKLNLHAIYLDTQQHVERNEIDIEHFVSWAHWAQQNSVGLDFNPSCFSHPMFDNGFTLAHPKKDIRNFWITHIKQSRKINEYFGRTLNKRSIMNIWIPDGHKDITVDMLYPRRRLMESLDECLSETLDKQYHLDVVESKLFGIGTESYVVGSHEFYMGYAMSRKIALCLDTGHFHPCEFVSNKLSALSLFLQDIFLHVSRPVRWDSDHVVILNEELITLAQEILRQNLEHRIHIGMDFFDASINRIAAWIIGARNVRKALLIAGLEPVTVLYSSEENFDFTKRLVYLEELKSYPWQAVWNYYCYMHYNKLCIGLDWYSDIMQYEKEVMSRRVS